MKRYLPQSDLRERRAAPPAFTLVELLVAMAIFVLLATLTVSAFRGNESDRISAGTGTLRNAIEGARSRAVKSGQIRGLRLIVDPNDARIATSLIYVGSPGYDEGNGNLSWSANQWTFSNNDTSTPTIWSRLDQRGLLSTGLRIEIPKDSGKWFTITGYNASATPPTVTLAGQYAPCNWDNSSSSYIAVPATNLTFRLELMPTILPGAEPILLPRNTCIDLDGAKLPFSWRAVEDTNRNGLLDTSGMPPEADKVPTGSFTFSVGYSSAMDILFSPRGTPIGAVATTGIICLPVANIADVLLIRDQFRTLGTSGDFSSVSGTTYAQGYLLAADPEHGQRAVALFANTGGILISEINPASNSNNASPNNDLANNPYSFVIRGKEAK
ncbi:prepilin-type N-terminal cleavage/methylation domain-containing protein [Planctomicrobium piriforme]|uniref:Prepilin-type N-terminal cleavage/methylation domain-containing protein n=1 Tax=Planctomicrobium piriforme TaxID=1576369 RepID=A0A1I3RWL6_9PLAN|nr:prepilin-type N-terminal cleavage/methylation domain-containing protein [Planctomicrobium piriforme]SFJ50795.1 prepilin-type N-terminal cleavage/methylation domain-containing protein [Planctomicrobium piriforme]